MTRIVLAACTAFAACALACGTSQPPAAAHAPRPTPLPPIDDAQIAELERDAARTELAEASLAHALARDPEVRRFAGYIESDDHALTTQEMRTLARLRLAPAPSAVSDTMDLARRRELAVLRPEFGDGFDRRFVAAQIDHDQQMLDLIDGTLLPTVKSHPLRSTLLEVRPIVAMHLAEARRLQARLQAR